MSESEADLVLDQTNDFDPARQPLAFPDLAEVESAQQERRERRHKDIRRVIDDAHDWKSPEYLGAKPVVWLVKMVVTLAIAEGLIILGRSLMKRK